MKIICEVHEGENKTTIISDEPNSKIAVRELQEALRVLFPPIEVRVTKVHRDKGDNAI